MTGPTIGDLAAACGEGSTTPSEALAKSRSAIEARNGSLNALVCFDWTRAEAEAAASSARWRAGAPRSPIDGAPLVVKVNCAVAGLPWTAALTPFANQVAIQDSRVVTLLREAGGVIIGAANMHEAALGATTMSPLYGPCFNPLREGYSPGGSSGGSAAAVAAGFCAGAVGTDTMGSVRIPSAYCGIVGFKPSYGRISTSGVIPLSPALDHVGFHAHTVADVAALYRACAGYDSEDAQSSPFTAEPPPVSPESMRVGVARTGVRIEPGVEAAFAEALSILKAMGVQLVDVDLSHLDLARMRPRGLLLCEADLLAAFPSELSDRGQLSAELGAMLTWAEKQSASKLAEAHAERAHARLAARRVFEHVDILLLPTAPQVAFPHGAPAPDNQADLTVFASFAGLPATCIPLALVDEGLPASLQVLAPYGHDARALAFAGLVERALT